MAKPEPIEPRRVLRGISARDEARPATEVLASIPWDGHQERDELPAEAFLALLWD